MKIFLLLTILSFCFLVKSYSQDYSKWFNYDYTLEIKSESNITKINYDWNLSLDEDDGRYTINENFSIGLSARIYKWLYLKGTVGSAHLNSNLIRMRWDAPIPGSSDVNTFKLAMEFDASQVYIELLPEIRLLKGFLYFNIGAGIVQLYDFRKYFVYNFFKNRRLVDYPGYLHYENEKYFYFVSNIGANIHYQNIGLIIELGFKRTGTYGKTKFQPGLIFSHFITKLGISYNWD